MVKVSDLNLNLVNSRAQNLMHPRQVKVNKSIKDLVIQFFFMKSVILIYFTHDSEKTFKNSFNLHFLKTCSKK
jgi:hypothetical protein